MLEKSKELRGACIQRPHLKESQQSGTHPCMYTYGSSSPDVWRGEERANKEAPGGQRMGSTVSVYGSEEERKRKC